MLDLFKVMKREFKFLFSYKRLLVIILLVPILFSAFYAYLYQDNVVSHLKVGIVDHKPSGVTRQIIRGFDKSPDFKVTPLVDEEEILPLIERDEIDGAIVFPADFTKKVKNGKGSNVFASANGTNLLISNNFMVKSLGIINTFDTGIVMKKVEATGSLEPQAFGEAMPMSLTVSPWHNPTNGYANFFMPGLIMFVVQQATFLVIAITITNERKNRTLPLLIKHYNTFGIVVGKILTYTLLSLVSSFASIYVVFKYFAMPVYGSYFAIGILVLAFSLCICSMGIFLSTIFNNSLDAIQYSMLIALPSFLLSGYTWPMQAMPAPLAFLGRLLPLTYVADNLRKLSLIGVDLDIMRDDILFLLLITLVFFTLTMLIFWFRFKRVKVKKGKKISAPKNA